MFTGEGNTLDAAEELRVYIRSLYEYFLKENRTKSSARVLVDFLKNYSEETAAMRKIV
jgi:hypothetical protein